MYRSKKNDSSVLNANFDQLFAEINAKETRMTTLETNALHWDGSSTGLTAATGRTSLGLGTAANNIVQLTGAAKLPAVDGGLLLNAIPPIPILAYSAAYPFVRNS